MNKGSTIEPAPGIKVTAVRAEHSSIYVWRNQTTNKGETHPGGEAIGWIIELENGFRIYHAGDTAVFGDMKYIGERYKPDLALVPIGGHFTLGSTRRTVPYPPPRSPIPNTMPREIRDFFESYRDAFNTLDGNAIAEFYAEPSGIAQDGAYTYWPERQPVAENMIALCKMYGEKGFIRADFEPCQFIDQGEKYAVADVQWRIDWSDGHEPWRFKTTYNLVRTAQGWKVLLCTAYSEAALHRSTGGRFQA